VLIQRDWNGQRYFVFPGGGVEDGETPEEAARREAMEELGLDVEVGALVAEATFEGRTQRYFSARIRSGTFGTGTGPWKTDRGTHRPVWVSLRHLVVLDVRPQALADALVDGLPDDAIVIHG
jgi:8-oxo-dGTP diphosphatase